MPLDRDIAKTGNLTLALRAAIPQFGTKTVEFWKDEYGEYTQSRTLYHLYNLALNFGTSLIDAEVNEGAIVSVLMETNEDILAAEQGILATGAAIGSLYTDDSPGTLVDKLNDMESAVLVVDNLHLGRQTQLERLLPYMSQLPKLHTVFVKGELPDSLPSELKFISLRSAFKGKEEHSDALENRIARITSETLARVIYSSGTTGKPKGVLLTHKNILATIDNTTQALTHLNEHDRLAVYLPHAHSFGAFVYNMIILLGAEQWYTHRRTTAQDLPKIKPTVLIGVPKSWEKTLTRIREGIYKKIPLFELSQHLMPRNWHDCIIGYLSREKALKKAGLDAVETYIGGGGYHSDYLIGQIGLLLGEGKFLLGSGPTECGPVVSVCTRDANKLGSAGKPIPGVEVRIIRYSEEIEPDKRWNADYTICKPGEEGLIVVKSPGNTRGYLNAKEATRQLFTTGGWVMVGDIGYIDEDGYLYVFGREGDRKKFPDGNFHDLCMIAQHFREATQLTYIDQVVADGVYDANGKFKTVAVVALDYDPERQSALASRLGIKLDNRFIWNLKLREAVEKEAIAAMKALEANSQIHLYDRVKAVLYVEPPSLQNKGITSTFKLRTGAIRDAYHASLVELVKGGHLFAAHPE